jgi:hypothetical protein
LTVEFLGLLKDHFPSNVQAVLFLSIQYFLGQTFYFPLIQYFLRQKKSSKNKKNHSKKTKRKAAPNLSVLLIDYRCADKKKIWRIERRNWRHSIGLDSLLQ